MPLQGNPIGPLCIWPGLSQYFFGGMNPNNQANVANSEFAEALTAANPGNKSITLVVPGIVGGRGTSQRQITWSTEFPSAPGAVSISLQAAMRDVDGEYTTIDTSTAINGERRTVQDNCTFYRMIVNSASGGSSPTVIAKARAM